VRDARDERFDFLGYTFGPHRDWKDGHWYPGASPSKKSVQRIKTKIGDLMSGEGKRGNWPCLTPPRPSSTLHNVVRLRTALVVTPKRAVR
jgi:hypothetical protein